MDLSLTGLDPGPHLGGGPSSALPGGPWRAGDPRRAARRLAGWADPVAFGLRNANKASVLLDLDEAAGRAELLRLAGFAAIPLDASSPETAAARTDPGGPPAGASRPGRRLDDRFRPDRALPRFPGDRAGADRARRRPVPLGAARRRAGAPAARADRAHGGGACRRAAPVAYVHRLRTGIGEHVDVCALEAAATAPTRLRHPGSAAAGRPESFPSGRPHASDFYPVFGCADGHVRLCRRAPSAAGDASTGSARQRSSLICATTRFRSGSRPPTGPPADRRAVRGPQTSGPGGRGSPPRRPGGRAAQPG